MRWPQQLGRRAWEQNKREPEAADCCSPLCCSAPHFSSMISSYLLCSALNLCSALPQRLQSVGTLASALCCLVLRCMARGGGLNGRVMGGWGSARSPHSSPLRLRSLHLSTSEGGHLPTYLHLGDQPREPRDRETASEGHLPCIHILGATSPLLHLQDKLSTSSPLKESSLSTSVKRK